MMAKFTSIKEQLSVAHKLLVKFEEKNTTGFDYLIKMSLYSFTEEEIEKLKKEHDKIQGEYQDLQEKTIEDLWTSECSQFMKQYRRMKLNSEK